MDFKPSSLPLDELDLNSPVFEQFRSMKRSMFLAEHWPGVRVAPYLIPEGLSRLSHVCGDVRIFRGCIQRGILPVTSPQPVGHLTFNWHVGQHCSMINVVTLL